MQLQKEKVQRLVKYISSVLLVIVFTSLADKQEDTTWLEAMPQRYISQYISAEQSATERTIAHLFDERIAMPIHAIVEIPGYHPHHSKPKCLHIADKLNHNNSYMVWGKGFPQLQSPNYHHVIDYYIYTLEHILI